jgi:hypothetical protein
MNILASFFKRRGGSHGNGDRHLPFQRKLPDEHHSIMIPSARKALQVPVENAYLGGHFDPAPMYCTQVNPQSSCMNSLDPRHLAVAILSSTLLCHVRPHIGYAIINASRYRQCKEIDKR